jgi:hypothetical protein
MTKDRKDHATRTLAGMLRVLDDPESTPEQVRAARDWGAIAPGSAVDWLRGYAAGRRDGRRVTPGDRVREA